MGGRAVPDNAGRTGLFMMAALTEGPATYTKRS
jgi:hypothetical protein